MEFLMVFTGPWLVSSLIRPQREAE